MTEQAWHSDMSYTRTPTKYSWLLSRVLPGAGGITTFSNQVAALSLLSADDRAALEGALGIHSYVLSLTDRLRRGLVGAKSTENGPFLVEGMEPEDWIRSQEASFGGLGGPKHPACARRVGSCKASGGCRAGLAAGGCCRMLCRPRPAGSANKYGQRAAQPVCEPSVHCQATAAGFNSRGGAPPKPGWGPSRIPQTPPLMHYRGML